MKVVKLFFFKIQNPHWPSGRLFLMLGILLFSYSSCQKDQAVESPSVRDLENQEILTFLEGQEFNPEEVTFNEDFVQYEKDAGWDRAGLLKFIRGEQEAESQPADPDNPELVALEGEERQRGLNDWENYNAVTKGRVSDLRYFIRSSVQNDCGWAWVSAIDQAASAWSNLSTTRVSLTRTYSEYLADIVFGSDLDTGLPSSHQNIPYIALAGFPNWGTPWRWVSIGADQDNWSSKKKTAMHEIGHCLGYHHTNTNSGTLIHGTSYTDNSSIMKQGSNTNPYFTTGDQRAVRIYYPEGLNNASNISVSKAWNGGVKITYKNDKFITKPYYWIRVYKYNSWGIYMGYKDFLSLTSNNTGFHTLYWGGHGTNQTYRFAIRGYNFRKDLYSGNSAQYSVTL